MQLDRLHICSRYRLTRPLVTKMFLLPVFLICWPVTLIAHGVILMMFVSSTVGYAVRWKEVRIIQFIL